MFISNLRGWKSPFSVSGHFQSKLEQNIGKAIHQLRGGKEDLKLIALSVSRLLCSGDPFSIPNVADRQAGHPYLQGRLATVADQTKRFWRGKLDFAGIFFYAFMPIRCPQRPNYFFERGKIISPLRDSEPTLTLLKCLVQGMPA